MGHTRDSDRKFERERNNRVRHHSQLGTGKNSPYEPIARKEPGLDLYEPERFEGWVVSWDADRGFGFISTVPSQRKGSLFVHQTRVRRIDGERPQLAVGTKVSFAHGHDRDGRSCAVDVRVLEWPEMSIEDFFLRSAEELPSLSQQ